MKLSGKCKQEFIKWMCENYPEIRWHEYETMPETSLNALIIDFFDSAGIFIIIQKLVYEPLFDCHINGLKNQITSGSFDTRDEATIEAILKANEIFNENNKEN